MTWIEFISVAIIPIATLIFFLLYVLYVRIETVSMSVMELKVKIAEEYAPKELLEGFRKELLDRLDKIADRLDSLQRSIYTSNARDNRNNNG